MKIIIPFLGKTKEDYLQKGITDYYHRLQHYTRIEIRQLKVKKRGASLSAPEMQRLESELLNGCCDTSVFRIVLDVTGRSLDSEAFAQLLIDLENRGIRQAAFIIGGPAGLAEEQLKRANMKIRLSSLTFPHDIARLLLLEQLYRGYTIKAGEKYHK